jgi:hypothetical protein
MSATSSASIRADGDLITSISERDHALCAISFVFVSIVMWVLLQFCQWNLLSYVAISQ